MVNKTPTEILIECLERFNTCEAKSIIVVYTDEKNGVVCSSNAHRVESVGLLEVAKDMVLRTPPIE
jgi:hypothetical protein